MKIGFIGLGIMGEAMCGNIIRKHDDQVYLYDVEETKAAALAEAAAKDGLTNAIVAKDSRELAKNADVIISMVPKSEHSRSVYTGILPELKEGKICIDMSTIDPSVSVEIAEMVKKTGADFADAPVVKSRPAAEAGKLGIYVGCEEKLFDRILPVLSYMGENVIRMGENGKGLVMKICHNALVSQIQNGVNETSTLAAAAGIDILTLAWTSRPFPTAEARTSIWTAKRMSSARKTLPRHFPSKTCIRMCISAWVWPRITA